MSSSFFEKKPLGIEGLVARIAKTIVVTEMTSNMNVGFIRKVFVSNFLNNRLITTDRIIGDRNLQELKLCK